ncbi:MAG: hypothetical protein AAFN12_08730 [Cyanobacteria bacterium J06560_2]
MNFDRSTPPSDNIAFDLSQARKYAARLSSKTEHEQVRNPMLTRLKESLIEAIAAAEAVCESNESFAERMEKHSQVLWLCNQYDYYEAVSASEQRSAGHALKSDTPKGEQFKGPNRQGLRQIQGVVTTLIFLKLLSYIRAMLPGPNPPTPSWKDILPGIWLWTPGAKRYE